MIIFRCLFLTLTFIIFKNIVSFAQVPIHNQAKDSVRSNDELLPSSTDTIPAIDSLQQKEKIENELGSPIPDDLNPVNQDAVHDLVPQNDTNSLRPTEDEGIGLINDADSTNLIRGVVFESDGKTPLIGAIVSWEQHEMTIQTDINGAFQLPYHENDMLIVKSLGFSEKRIPIKPGMNDVRVILENDSKTRLEEVVVTAMGIERDTRTLSYDIQQIIGSEVNEIRDPGGNVMNSLSGKIPGLVTTAAAGGLGSPVRVALRGNRSIRSGNNALIIVDGVPVNNNFGSQPSDESGGYAGLDGSVSINPDDIESISVLKGQSAAALYGGSAANGAILINTNKGSAGDLSVNYNGGISILDPNLLINYQNKYGRGNQGVYAENSGFSWGAPATTYRNNVKDFFNTGMQVNNSINFSGGSETLQGYASYTNNTGNGNIGNNQMTSHTINARVTGKISGKISTDFKINYVDQEIKNRPRTGEIGTVLNAYIIPRDMSPSEFNHYEEFDRFGQPYPATWPTSNASIYTNPYWHVNRTSYNIKRNRTIILGSAKYEFTNWLNLQARYNVDFINDRTTSKFYDKSVLLAPSAGGQYSEAFAQNTNQYFDLLLSGENSFQNDFNIQYNLGASFQNVNSSNVNSTANGLNISNLFILQNAVSYNVSSSESQVMRQGVFGTAQLGYKDYLFLDGTVRNDWSSTLPKPYNFIYPSVGLTAVLSDALKMPSWVTFGKVRGTFAFVGNDAPAYIIHQYYSYAAGSGNGFISRDAAKAIENLKPEQTKSFEFGTEWSFFDDRLSTVISLYQTNTYNQLLSLSTTPSTGFSTKWINAGNVENKGIEVMISGMPIRSDNFSWITSVNFARNVNKIIELSEELKESKLSGSERLGIVSVKEGESYGDIYGQVWKKNEQGQRIVDANGLPVIETDQKVGNFNPKFMVGWSNSLKYKDITLSFQIDGRVGGNVISGTDAYLAYYGLADYTENFREGGLILDAVHEDGSQNNTEINAEQLWTNVSGGRTAMTEFFTYDATNFRLRELALSYTFNIDKPYLRMAKLSLVGGNLFFLYRGNAILKIPGMPDRKIPTDPEVGLGAGNSQGLESGLPPIPRSIGLNLKLFF